MVVTPVPVLALGASRPIRPEREAEGEGKHDINGDIALSDLASSAGPDVLGRPMTVFRISGLAMVLGDVGMGNADFWDFCNF